jgi:uncharacterized lipoprotein
MKKKTRILTILLTMAVIGLAGCSSDDDGMDVGTGDRYDFENAVLIQPKENTEVNPRS